jgi:lipopolysaccharide/colanic/teichoic acid biosynthesis glycosyltransferase
MSKKRFVINTDLLFDLLDLLLSVLFICIGAPLFAIACLLVKIDSRGPIFYTQERYGKNKKVFTIYKFRTMKVGAEGNQPVWGKEYDLRANRIGNFLRVTHIDELPQLLNVLKGEMSLVGPRPERPYFADSFQKIISGYAQRYCLKPGLTGWSQVNGLRGESSVEERTLFDRFYTNNRTLFFYLKIILLTPFAKPVKPEYELKEKVLYYSRVFSHAAEGCPEKTPLMVPARNA